MIATNSRYISDLVVRVQDANGNWNLAVYTSIPADQRIQYIYHTMTQGDTLTQLAYYAYNDDTLWWYIANANPEVQYWDDVPAGTVIRIPNGPSVV